MKSIFSSADLACRENIRAGGPGPGKIESSDEKRVSENSTALGTGTSLAQGELVSRS
jgi:hypothetical protein